ncbi:MAG: GtrA family protein [Clostridia bacterium]|nr:GtrA family protein [Clostridia bacterium]
MFKKLLSLFDVRMWKFLLVGVINTLVGNAIMYSLYNLAGCNVWLSSAANYTLTSILSFFLNKYFTFRYKKTDLGVVLRFALNIAVCYFIAYGIAQPLTEWILSGQSQTVSDNVAMLVGQVLFVGCNYLGQRLFAFRQKPENPTSDAEIGPET